MSAVLFLAAAIAAEPLQIAEPIIDAGEVRFGPPLIRRFEFQNHGDQPLTIIEIKSSCGCMAPKLAKRNYLPGEKGELTVEVNTLSQPIGSHRWAFQLNYRFGESLGQSTIELSARIKQEIEVTPAALAFRGEGPHSATVAIRDQRSAPRIHTISPAGVATSATFLTARKHDQSNAIKVCVTQDCPEGRHSESITIKTDDPDYPTIKIPVTIVREPKQRVAASPARANLVAGGSSLVQLRAADNTPIQIDTLDAGSAALTCRWAAGPGDRATVRIALDRTKWDGRPFSSEIRIQLSAPAGESMIIPVAVRFDD